MSSNHKSLRNHLHQLTKVAANTGVKAADASANVYAPASADTRPDYSPTTNESEDEHSLADTRFFLESDIPSGAPLDRTMHSVSRGPSTEQSYMDPRIYTKCMRCIQRHSGCDRRFPFCKSCKSASECVYWKKAGFQNQEEALRVYRASLLHETKQVPRRTSSFKPPKTSFKSESPQTQPNTAIKDIEWLDGDISHSQKKCPSSITKLIGRHLVEFDQSIARRLWSTGKTCYMDRGREAVYVDPHTDQEVPVARYRYGGGHQFFVVWLPGEDPSDALEPAICKFRVYNNDGPVMRNGTSWIPLMWRSMYVSVL